MNKKYNDNSYYYIVNNIMNNEEFIKIGSCSHHGLSRLDHSHRVSYYSYKVSKFLKLDYRETARAGLLHDFFITNDMKTLDKTKSLFDHSYLSLINSEKHFILSDKEKDIIETHMFPITISKMPKYMESWIVSIIDKVISLGEFTYSYSKMFKFKMQHAAVLSIFLVGRFL